MTKYREILRLFNLGISQTGIASSCGCARKTVRDVVNQAKACNIIWPLPDETTDADLEKLLFPDKSVPKSDRKFPDYDYIDREMLRSGVTLKLLWNEYCEGCRQNKDIPLMYTQFCHHYQKYSDKKRATMHIPRKPGEPGEQIEVDWAGKPDAGFTGRSLILKRLLSKFISIKTANYLDNYRNPGSDQFRFANYHLKCQNKKNANDLLNYIISLYLMFLHYVLANFFYKLLIYKELLLCPYILRFEYLLQ
jgi:hypothetical protein